MRAQLHLLSETILIDVELPEAAALERLRARLSIYSNIDHTRWEAKTANHVVEVISTTPDPAATILLLATKLRALTSSMFI